MEKNSQRSKLWLAALAVTMSALSTEATSLKVTITVDNSYALFTGSGTAATAWIGSDSTWWLGPEIYNFNLPANDYIYVVTASDLSGAQGFLAQFENLDNGNKFYSNDPQWQVMATGLTALGGQAPYTGSPADLALLSQEIVDANGGGNPSNGWVPLTAGPNNGSFPWGTISGIDLAAKWAWYSSNGDLDPTTPGFNHHEWLVFRIPVAAAPVGAPDAGATAGLLTLGLLGVGAAHRRAKR